MGAGAVVLRPCATLLPGRCVTVPQGRKLAQAPQPGNPLNPQGPAHALQKPQAVSDPRLSTGLNPDFLSPVTTEDGSVTYHNSRVNATYRSVHGAASESRHVFLRGTRLETRPSPWRVLELGFGTGLNFATTLEAALAHGVELHYTSLEPNLIPSELWLIPEAWRSLTPDEPFRIGPVTLTIVRSRWQEYTPLAASFDAVYHDPFGPGAAPECWEAPCFAWSHAAIAPEGVLATFGASSAARRALKAAGYLVGSQPGAGGKREMTVASKSAEAISEAKPWKRHS